MYKKQNKKKNYKVLTIQAEAALRAGRSRSNRTGSILSHGTSQVSTSVARSLWLLKAPLITPLQKHLLSSQKNYIWHISLCLPKVTLWELQYQVWCDHGVWVRKMACGVIYSYYDHLIHCVTRSDAVKFQMQLNLILFKSTKQCQCAKLLNYEANAGTGVTMSTSLY